MPDRRVGLLRRVSRLPTPLNLTSVRKKVQSHRSIGAQCRVHADEEHSASLGFARHAFPSRKQQHSIGPNDGHLRDHESWIRRSNRTARISEDTLSTGGRRVTISLSFPPSPSPRSLSQASPTCNTSARSNCSPMDSCMQKSSQRKWSRCIDTHRNS